MVRINEKNGRREGIFIKINFFVNIFFIIGRDMLWWLEKEVSEEVVEVIMLEGFYL